MNKHKLFKALTDELTQNLEAALNAAKNTYDIATHEDNKAENKYDTRGLEASYLAGAQAERVRDLKETVGLIITLPIKEFTDSDKISLSALIHLESNEKESWLLLLPKGGGHNFKFENISIKVVTPDSPLGNLLVGKFSGDSFTLNNKEYTILKVY